MKLLVLSVACSLLLTAQESKREGHQIRFLRPRFVACMYLYPPHASCSGFLFSKLPFEQQE